LPAKVSELVQSSFSSSICMRSYAIHPIVMKFWPVVVRTPAKVFELVQPSSSSSIRMRSYTINPIAMKLWWVVMRMPTKISELENHLLLLFVCVPIPFIRLRWNFCQLLCAHLRRFLNYYYIKYKVCCLFVPSNFVFFFTTY
jgi:hypothetical protein